MENEDDIYLDECCVCDVPIYTSDPHELYVDGDGDYLHSMVFLAHFDCTPPPQFQRLLNQRPTIFDQQN